MPWVSRETADDESHWNGGGLVAGIQGERWMLTCCSRVVGLSLLLVSSGQLYALLFSPVPHHTHQEKPQALPI